MLPHIISSAGGWSGRRINVSKILSIILVYMGTFCRPNTGEMVNTAAFLTKSSAK
jgi:hypothetical protein